MLSFAPDALTTAPEVLTEVSAVPTPRGYKSPPAGTDMGVDEFVDTPPQGGAYLVKLDGSSRSFVGSETTLYESSGGSWADVSRASPAYSNGTSRWRFAQFGDTSLAIAKGTVLQQSSTGDFANVANSPKADLMECVAGFVMLANTDDTSLSITGGPNSDQPHRWWCSQIFNPTGTWAPSVSTQATTGLLVETAGPITGLRRLLNDIVAYKSTSIYVGQYVGPPVVWQWRCVSKDVGVVVDDAVVDAGTAHIFIGDDDIYMFDGSRPIPIGSLIREWFFGRLNRSYASYIRALHYRTEKLIYWFYPSGSDETLTSVLAYHYGTQRWGAFDLEVLEVLETKTTTVSYDSLGSKYSTYDDMPEISYDSPFWIAATPVMGYISASGYLTSLSGGGGDMSLTTGWMGDEAGVTVATRVRPRFRIAPSSGMLVPESVMSLGDAASTGSSRAMHNGRFDVLQAARFHKFQLSFTGQCEIEAVTPTLVPEAME